MNKKPKYKQGDKLNWTSSDKQRSCIVTLLERYDKRSADRVAWMVKRSDGKGQEFAVAEDELTLL